VTTFTFPTGAELDGIEQVFLPQLTRDNPAFEIFPSINKDVPLLMWEQLDNFLGFMAPRGLGGRPTLVKPVGSKTYQMSPGYYGEFMTLDEAELTLSRKFASFNEPVDVTDLVVQRGNQLLHRQLQRERWLVWQLLSKGYFLSTNAAGAILHADSYTQRTFTATVTWATVASATPFADCRAIRPYARGYSVSFGRGARGYANNTTIRNFLNNTNSADVGGKRRDVGATFNSLANMNEFLNANDCFELVEWDGVWQDDTGANNLDIPDNTVIVVGRRLDGAPIGQMVYTRNVNNPGFAPGPYFHTFQPPTQVPATVEVHRGVNCGIALHFPGAIVVMSV
jgi:hypothetical protein